MAIILTNKTMRFSCNCASFRNFFAVPPTSGACSHSFVFHNSSNVSLAFLHSLSNLHVSQGFRPSSAHFIAAVRLALQILNNSTVLGSISAVIIRPPYHLPASARKIALFCDSVQLVGASLWRLLKLSNYLRQIKFFFSVCKIHKQTQNIISIVFGHFQPFLAFKLLAPSVLSLNQFRFNPAPFAAISWQQNIRVVLQID